MSQGANTESGVYAIGSAFWRSLLPEISVVLLYFAIRFIGLTETLPVFVDEATLLSRARDMLHGETFDVLTRGGKWLPVALVAAFRPTGPETLWVARGIVALLSTLSCAVAIGLGRSLDSRLTGFLAGLLALLVPMAVFHERQALADPLMSTFVNLALIFVLLLARTGRWRYVVGATLALVAAALSKLTGLLFLVIPIAGGLLLARRFHKGRIWVQALVTAGLALVLTVGTLLVISDPSAPFQRLGTLVSDPPSFVCRHTPLCVAADSGGGRGWDLALKLELYRGILAYYFGWPLLVLAGGALLLMRDSRWRAVLYLLLPAVVLAGGIILVSSWYPARYFNFTVVGLAVLGALALANLWRLGRRLAHGARWRSTVVGAALGAIVVFPLAWQAPVTLRLLRAPHLAGLPPPDYIDCNGYGFGYNRVGATLKAWQREHGGQVSVLARGALRLRPYWGERMGAVEGWRNNEARQALLASLVRAGDAIFFVDTLPARAIPDAPFGASVEEVATFPLPCGEEAEEMRVRRMVDPGPELRRSVYELAFPSPDELSEQYRAVALFLVETEAEGAVVVYPPHQVDLLENRLEWGTGLDGIYAVGDSWPLDTRDAGETLAALAAEHGDLHVVFLEETNGDPDGFIRAWLDDNMTLVSQDWFGPVELLHYTHGGGG